MAIQIYQTKFFSIFLFEIILLKQSSVASHFFFFGQKVSFSFIYFFLFHSFYFWSAHTNDFFWIRSSNKKKRKKRRRSMPCIYYYSMDTQIMSSVICTQIHTWPKIYAFVDSSFSAKHDSHHIQQWKCRFSSLLKALICSFECFLYPYRFLSLVSISLSLFLSLALSVFPLFFAISVQITSK